MPTNSNADFPDAHDKDAPLDARIPEGTLPPQRLADVADVADISSLDASSDPADAIPVPLVMEPAEIDERAQAVEAVRGNHGLEPRTDV